MMGNNGVPALLGQIGEAVNVLSLLEADVVNIANMFAAPQWGLVDSGGQPILTPDSVISVELRQEWRVSDYPIEPNSFESYNKVIVPAEIRVSMAKGGSDSDRDSFIGAVDDLGDNLTPFNILTPETTWLSYTLSHYDFRRTSTNGVTLLVVELWCTRVSISVQSSGAIQNPASPSGASPSGGGIVQTNPPATPTATNTVVSGIY